MFRHEKESHGLIGIMAAVVAGFSLSIDFSAVRVAPDNLPRSGFLGLMKLINAEMKTISMELILAIVFACICVYIYSNRHKNVSVHSVALGVLFALFLTIGESFRYWGNLGFFHESGQQAFIAVVAVIGFSVLFYVCIELIKELFESKIKKEDKCFVEDDRHFAKAACIAIFLCWGVFSVPFLPGSVPHDGRRQLIMFDGYAVMTNHHPYMATVILGTLVSIGRRMFGSNCGVILVVILQMGYGAFVFAGICDTVRIRVSKKAAYFTALFYILCPLWWTYVQAVIKDTVFFLSFSWLTLICFRAFWNMRDKHALAQTVIAAFLTCAFRNEGIYYALLLLGITLLLVKNRRKMFFLAFCIMIGIGLLTTWITRYSLGIQQRNPFESKSIVVQQIARVIKERSGDISERDLEIIDKVVDIKDISARYNPELSDPVKNGYRSNATEEDWHAFWKLWLRWAKEYPVVYVEAIIGECFGYFDPLYFYNGSLKYHLYNKEYLQEQDKGVVYSQYWFPKKTRDAVYDACMDLDRIPIVSLIVNPATYTWLSMAMLFIGPFQRKKWYLLLPLMNLGICVISPVNGYVRYMLPIVASMPLYLALFIGKES